MNDETEIRNYYSDREVYTRSVPTGPYIGTGFGSLYPDREVLFEVETGKEIGDMRDWEKIAGCWYHRQRHNIWRRK